MCFAATFVFEIKKNSNLNFNIELLPEEEYTCTTFTSRKTFMKTTVSPNVKGVSD